MASRLTPERRARMRAFILSPRWWPLYPLLPLKQPGALEAGGLSAGLGVLVCTGDITPTTPLHVLHDVNLLEGERIKELVKNLDDATVYASVDELLDAGWEVD